MCETLPDRDGHFEHHLKLRLPAGYDRAALESLAVPHGAHVSWNARRSLAGAGPRASSPNQSASSTPPRRTSESARCAATRGQFARGPGRPDRPPDRRAGIASAPGRKPQVRLDFVFDEHLPAAPEPVELGCGALTLAASPERYPLPYGLLRDVFRLAAQWPMPNREVELQDFANLVAPDQHGTEWQHFETEYPHLARAGEASFVERLVKALEPTFAPPGQP